MVKMSQIESQSIPIIMSKEIATYIVDNVRKTVNYNLNIMNERGIVVASSDPSRVGTFHEVAFQIIAGTEDVIEVDQPDDFIGTHNGINMAIKYKSIKCGVLGITGAPNEVRPLAMVLKLCVESMLAYELQQQANMQQYSRQKLLENSLIRGNSSSTELKRWAAELNINPSVYRIPLLIQTDRSLTNAHKAEMVRLLTENTYFEAQDIFTSWEGQSFVVFKAFSDAVNVPMEYRQIIEAFMQPLFDSLVKMNIHLRVFVGSISNRLSRHHDAFRRALWLAENNIADAEKIVYFYDHLDKWASSFVPAGEFEDIYRPFLDALPEGLEERMLQAESALMASDYSFPDASQMLFVHKNTLFSWVDKVRMQLNIDPVKRLADREFWKQFCEYCRSKS